jgi:hypothetical protein
MLVLSQYHIFESYKTNIYRAQSEGILSNRHKQILLKRLAKGE